MTRGADGEYHEMVMLSAIAVSLAQYLK